MGVLTASGAISPDAAPGVKDPKPEPEAPAEGAKQDGDFVPFSKIESQRQPGSRRERAERQVAELIEARVKPLEEKVTTDREAYEKRIQEANQEIARLQGQYEALQSRPAPTPPAPAAPAALPDPDQLMAEAEAALEKNDLREYHKKLQRANEAIADRKADERVSAVRKEMESRIPPQLPREIQDLMAQHRNVAMAGQAGIQAVMIKDQELGLRRAPPGPARMAKAFQMADEMLEQINKPASTPHFSRDSAAGLAAAPPPRAAAAPAPAGEAGYQPTEADKAVMRAMNWSANDFVKWKFPDKWMKR